MSELAAQLDETEIELDSTEGQGSAAAVVQRRDQRGMVSAEWAVGLIAAIAIAGVLLTVVTTGSVRQAILGFVLMVIEAFSRGL